MNRRRLRIVVGVVAVTAAVVSIAIPIFSGKYLEAIAVSGVVSVFAWFALRGLERATEKHAYRPEAEETRER